MKRIKKIYGEDQSKRELELSKEFLKKSNERMDNDNPLFCVIENQFNMIFLFGDFITQSSKLDHLKLKQATQKNNEFDIRGNEEFVFTYGLANDEMVLHLCIKIRQPEMMKEFKQKAKQIGVHIVHIGQIWIQTRVLFKAQILYLIPFRLITFFQSCDIFFITAKLHQIHSNRI
ncbi:hypothetical protein RFI_19868 [Reticulomyxa filosa]|uniref:Transmembrane protein n=1 Tax=Reticulomyxa filosa TaxID=46433 RepID=X6MVJ0_RETFI|nr:hypothetical protein RFI_19868 [Reticulomyxa filosa]|eukprot:ETO17457.1 hypothetical protein RFI_19868 [Reticulomyxa filosa]